jgi:ankyrin repeat protein
VGCKYIAGLWAGAGVCLLLSQSVSAGDDRLIDAARKKDAAGVRMLLRQHVDVNGAQGDGVTALHWAVHVDDREIVQALLGGGAKVNVADDTGVTPLYLACLNRDVDVVKLLLKASADPNAALLNGETPLMNCARTGNAEAVKVLLAAGARINDKEKGHDQTALMWAAAQSQSEAVHVLLEAGADLRARSRTYPQMVTGEQTQRAGREELSYWTRRGGSTALLFAARSGDVASARWLLEAGADPNDRLPDGTSALIQAAYSGNSGVAILLLEKGADPNDSTIGFTALHAAVLKSELDVVKALLAKGANPDALVVRGTPVRRNTTDFYIPGTLIGATPYLMAAKFLEPDIMRALTAAGANAHATLTDGSTALMLAAGIGAVAGSNRRGVAVLDGGVMEPPDNLQSAIVAALDSGVNVDAVNGAGDTALHAAANLGHAAIVKLLVEKGATLNVKNKRGLTPLALAQGLGNRRLAAAAASADGPTGPPENKAAIDVLLSLGATL